ncbi:protein cereblon [Trifolium pratense]|uniref:Protein cereblon n=1 Tax=Trifolium pratense TaxID=57577 RepID=A0A2K3P430_TRIPR|nr:protein cereblon [Trifolium pratense]
METDDEIEVEEGGIPETEELQIDQFLFEEEDDEQFDHPLIHFSSPSSSSSSQDQPNGIVNGNSSDEFTFNTSIASLHTYLGDVEDTSHRTDFLDGGAIFNLPLFCLQGVVLFPGATLPLRVTVSRFVTAIERALSQVDVPYTIAVIRSHRETGSFTMKAASIGTTAVIRQYGHLEDGSLNVVTRGQQRFHLRRHWNDVDGVPYGEIQIIEEDLPLRTPRDAFGKSTSSSNILCRRVKVHALNGENDSEANLDEGFKSKFSSIERKTHLSVIGCGSASDTINVAANSSNVNFMHKSDQEMGSNLDLSIENCSTSGKQSSEEGFNRCLKNIRSHKISNAFLPHWVYRMYDPYWLAQRAADMWKQIIGVPSMDSLIKKPGVLSFHIASKIPVSESTRQQLLDIDGIVYRLRREIELLDSIDLIRCRRCQTTIAKRSNMLVMSDEGPLGAYVNPGGYVHEIMTLYKANGLSLVGHAVTEYSWFPGYAWTIANCATCGTQMGWLFTTTNKKLKPGSFWGIRSCQVAEEIPQNL